MLLPRPSVWRERGQEREQEQWRAQEREPEREHAVLRRSPEAALQRAGRRGGSSSSPLFVLVLAMAGGIQVVESLLPGDSVSVASVKPLA